MVDIFTFKLKGGPFEVNYIMFQSKQTNAGLMLGWRRASREWIIEALSHFCVYEIALQTQDWTFPPWRSEVEHATSRLRRFPTILNLY